ncbi:Hypothetical protein I595_936 [Croceitalea dokdonensis DOKDO 023]|uniref:Cadherin domain-containing protein n=1 Tax=Croceitalea dokdonensis DOKDO 023 TaxID=1300341 RepID=A0A0P7AKZ4_9FLAO|nr:cadherin domain-containing protein [Croceitalea dokdonensis]KPM32518.1 Hypothetical protein I595_936 [Croceitalea dokdonensis DOKDO 023]
MKKSFFVLATLLAFSCSSDSEDIAGNEENTAPIIANQQFQIAEHAPSETGVGRVIATDANEDELMFILNDSEDFILDEVTGNITVGPNLQLDFESQTTYELSVSVFDGEALADATITINVTDINEFDELSDEQKELVAHFKHLTLFQDNTSPTQDVMRKWQEPMKLFLLGTFDNSARTMVQEVIADYNRLTDTGSFDISLVTNETEANAKLFLGTKASVESVFPAMYEQIRNLNVDGFAVSSFANDTYFSSEIWISNGGQAICRHELGHALGLGHSNLCDGENASVMCSSIRPQNQLLGIEEKVISYFYHEAMPTGLNENLIQDQLSNLILLEDF